VELQSRPGIPFYAPFHLRILCQWTHVWVSEPVNFWAHSRQAHNWPWTHSPLRWRIWQAEQL
jgi:hypothetical protein